MCYHIWVRESVWPAALAQLDRVFGYEPKGRGFESLTPRHKTKGGCPKDIHLLFYATSFHDSEPRTRGKAARANLRRLTADHKRPSGANMGSESREFTYTHTARLPPREPRTRGRAARANLRRLTADHKRLSAQMCMGATRPCDVLSPLRT